MKVGSQYTIDSISGSLKIERISLTQSGNFMCRAENKHGLFTIQVLYNPSWTGALLSAEGVK